MIDPAPAQPSGPPENTAPRSYYRLNCPESPQHEIQVTEYESSMSIAYVDYERGEVVWELVLSR